MHNPFSQAAAAAAEPLTPPPSADESKMVDFGAFYTPPNSEWRAQQTLQNVMSNARRAAEFRPVKYGQVTPPEPADEERAAAAADDDGDIDDSRRDGWRGHGGRVEPHTPIKQEDPADDSVVARGANKRKRTSTTATNTGQGEPTAPKRRRGRAAKTSTSSPTTSDRSTTIVLSPTDLAPSDPDPDSDGRRSKFLERNRVAASKCRQKKKEWTAGLERRARGLQASNAHLQLLAAGLCDEVLFLKGEMLRHTDCACAHVREYLAREAEHLAAHAGDDRGPFAHVGDAGGLAVGGAAAAAARLRMEAEERARRGDGCEAAGVAIADRGLMGPGFAGLDHSLAGSQAFPMLARSGALDGSLGHGSCATATASPVRREGCSAGSVSRSESPQSSEAEPIQL